MFYVLICLYTVMFMFVKARLFYFVVYGFFQPKMSWLGSKKKIKKIQQIVIFLKFGIFHVRLGNFFKNSIQMLRFYFMYCYLILNIYLCTFKYNNIIKLKKISSPSLSGRLIPEGLHIYCQDTTINLLNIFLMTQRKNCSSISWKIQVRLFKNKNWTKLIFWFFFIFPKNRFGYSVNHKIKSLA